MKGWQWSSLQEPFCSHIFLKIKNKTKQTLSNTRKTLYIIKTYAWVFLVYSYSQAYQIWGHDRKAMASGSVFFTLEVRILQKLNLGSWSTNSIINLGQASLLITLVRFSVSTVHHTDTITLPFARKEKKAQRSCET